MTQPQESPAVVEWARIFDPEAIRAAKRLTARRKSDVQTTTLHYNLRERLDWEWWGESPHVQDWVVSARHDQAEVASVEIIRADIQGEPYDLADAVDDIDGQGGTLGDVALRFLDDSCWPHKRLITEGNGGNNGTNILILDDLVTRADWDGFGFTTLFVGTALQRLVSDTLVVVTEPVPVWLKGKARREATPAAHRFCASLGFVPYKRGLWVHWLTPGDLDRRLSALRERFGLSGSAPYEQRRFTPL